MEGTYVESEREIEGRSHNWSRWLFVTVAVPVCYVLSVGPVAKLNNKGLVSDSFMVGLYAPLAWANDVFPFVNRFFD